MSNVRLSNGSPTLERTDARLSDHPKPTACRNLFGSVDHEELTRDLKGHLKEMEEAAAAKWNFDFSSHTPLLNGKYEWKKVDSKDIPTFYNTQQRSAKGIYPSGNNNVDLNGNHSCVLGTPRQPSENAERSETQFENKEQCTGQRKRPACHDPLSQNKRSHSSSDEVTCCPGLMRSVEHTPRKTSPRTQT
ncbi:cyclin-dependent kinase inhibitor 1Bb [Esox lucius]|uniref:cyclin-dependent kinase inhibitor 1Bb n=1 Tax=Esox lucius TaxID=8010 RepID=UPI000577DA11|nr:cyclin-dependent kinase inhibitor 1Bb [Esox lucius]